MTDKLSSLPTELLRDIIEATVPRTYHSSTYTERQRTLCSLSRVSHQFREIAQTLLFGIVYIESDPQLHRLAAVDKETLELKELVTGRYLEAKPIKELLGRCKGLESLVIANYDMDGYLDLGILVEPSSESKDQDSPLMETLLKLYPCAVSELVNLQIYTFRCPIPRSFSSLRSLTLAGELLSSTTGCMLNPEDLPSLRALTIRLFAASRLDEIVVNNLARLLPQLDAICVCKDVYRSFNDSLLSAYPSRTLVDVVEDELSAPDTVQSLASAQHLRIRTRGHWRSYMFQAIARFISVRRKLQGSPLTSIYLDSSLHSFPNEAIIKKAEFLQAMEECERGGIEVIFEQQPKYIRDWFISEKFWSRQRRRREGEQK
ncbi:uncharacterized protein JCM6883_002891 [Sporobolomyces salmoneus]|uniref:uncharacterized protein n=1 Tax=Sporobolomyces salmoneus TaxID=183962 RepID=UPI00317D51FA